MTKFWVTLMNTGFMSSAPPDDMTLTTVAIAEFNEKHRRQMPPGYQSLVSVSVSADDGQSDDDVHVFVDAQFVIEVADEAAAWMITTPRAFLDLASDAIQSAYDLGIDMDEIWEVSEVLEEHELEPASA